MNELSRHHFTKQEKFMAVVNQVDNVATVVALVSIPLTGGAAIGVIAMRLATKGAVKRSLKYGMKVGYRYAKKNTSRNFKRLRARLSGKEGKQVLWREVKELSGLAKKRGRPTQYAKVQGTMRKSFNLSEVGLQASLYIVPAMFARNMYCQNSASASSVLCQPEHASENICQHYKQGAL